MHDIDSHFISRKPNVRTVYYALLAAARKLGPVSEDAKKTSIHLNRRSAFLGVATRKDALILTIKADGPWLHPRIVKSEQISTRRWHHDLKLADPADIDDDILDHMARAYELSA